MPLSAEWRRFVSDPFSHVNVALGWVRFTWRELVWRVNCQRSEEETVMLLVRCLVGESAMGGKVDGDYHYNGEL